MISKVSLLIVTIAFFAHAQAQQLLTPSTTFSHKKASIITLKDGSEIKGELKGLKREKGLISQVKIEDENGKTQKIKPEDISFMYLPPSGLDKLSKAMDFLTDAQKWNDEKLDQDLLNQGYVYFENATVQVKKKKMVLLMQLLNPTFSKNVKVYHDPLAKETMSVGVGNIDVAGGDAKSYFIQVGEEVAYKVEKKKYDEEFPKLFGKCSTLAEKYPLIKWKELTNHIIDYTECEKP
jgi:hypothetical protein